MSKDVSQASDRGITNLEIRMAPAEQLPFEGKSFDFVTCRVAAHHFDDYAGAVREMARDWRSLSIGAFQRSLSFTAGLIGNEYRTRAGLGCRI